MNSSEMLEKLKEINADIRAKELKPFYFFYGNEDYFITSLKNSIINAFEDSTKLNVKSYNKDNFNVRDVIKYVLNEPFMNDKKLIIFDNLDYFKVSKKDREKEINELLDAFNKTKDINIVLFYKTEFDDKYAKAYKDNIIADFFKENGVLLELKKLDEDTLWKYVQNRFKKRNVEIDRVNIAYFIRICGNDLLNLFNEADKLVAYLGDRAKVEKSDIDAIVTRSLDDKIYTLIDLYNTNRIEESLKYYGDLITEGEKNEVIFASFSYNYTNLIICKDYMDRGKGLKEISEMMNMETWRVKKLMDANKFVSMDTLKSKVNRITKLSIDRMKSDVDKDLMVLLLMN